MKFLLACRHTPKVSTGVTPAYLMFGRELKTKLLERRSDKNILTVKSPDGDEYRRNSSFVKPYTPTEGTISSTVN